MDKLVEKIKGAIGDYDHRLAQLREEQYQNFGSPEWMGVSEINDTAKTEVAYQIKQIFLADPTIVEIDPDAKLPISDSLPGWGTISGQGAYRCGARDYMEKVKEAGWVKKKC